MEQIYDLVSQRNIVIGGSAGSFKTIIKILERLESFDFHTMILALHRPRKGNDKLLDVFCHNCPHDLHEPVEGEKIEERKIYLAPSNAHLLVKKDMTFSISNQPAPYFSKPSIDLTFQSAAEVMKDSLTGILLSGANEDGAIGLSEVKVNGGKTIIQDPADCLIDTMPRAAKEKTSIDAILTSNEIIDLFGNTLQV